MGDEGTKITNKMLEKAFSSKSELNDGLGSPTIEGGHEFEKAAMRLYEARLARDKAKKEFIECKKNGKECNGPELGYCYAGDEDGNIMEISKWCGACKEGQPLYLKRKSACKEVGMAMRALMQLCKKINKAS